MATIILHFHLQPQFIYELFHINFTLLAFFFASLRHFDLFNWETETSKCFKSELETFKFQDIQT